jgi:hypothetical protein
VDDSRFAPQFHAIPASWLRVIAVAEWRRGRATSLGEQRAWISRFDTARFDPLLTRDDAYLCQIKEIFEWTSCRLRSPRG